MGAGMKPHVLLIEPIVPETDAAYCVHPPVCGTLPRGTNRFNRFLGARHRYRRRTPEVGKKTQRRREQD
jgi:hypothetical protein